MLFTIGINDENTFNNMIRLYKENDMEWKELSKDELVKRIESAINYLDCGYIHEIDIITEILTKRPVQPKAPTHNEIMTKWWKDTDQTCSDHMNPTWLKVVQYVPEALNCYIINGQRRMSQESENWFIDKESADIPPEA